MEIWRERGITGHVLGLFLAQCSGSTPGSAWGMGPGLVISKTSVMTLVLYLGHNTCNFESLI